MGKVFWKRNIPYLLIILNIDIDIKTLIFHFEFLHGPLLSDAKIIAYT